MPSDSNNKYQKASSKKSSNSNHTQGNIAIQTIRYLVMNPLAVNYRLTQDIYSLGDNTTINAKQSYTN